MPDLVGQALIFPTRRTADFSGSALRSLEGGCVAKLILRERIASTMHLIVQVTAG